jgi:hypothetical protein
MLSAADFRTSGDFSLSNSIKALEAKEGLMFVFLRLSAGKFPNKNPIFNINKTFKQNECFFTCKSSCRRFYYIPVAFIIFNRCHNIII